MNPQKSPAQNLVLALVSSALILLCLGAGEALGHVSAKAGFALPGSVIGMVLLFLLLLTGWVRLERVEGAGGFLLEYLGLFFVPAGVALLARWHDLRDHWPAVLAAIIVSTAAVLWTTGAAAQRFQREANEK